MRLIWAGFPFSFVAIQTIFGGKPSTRQWAASPVAMRESWTNVPTAVVEPRLFKDLNFRARRIFNADWRYRPDQSLGYGNDIRIENPPTRTLALKSDRICRDPARQGRDERNKTSELLSSCVLLHLPVWSSR